MRSGRRWLLLAALLTAAVVAVFLSPWLLRDTDDAVSPRPPEHGRGGKARVEDVDPHLRGQDAGARPDTEPARAPTADEPSPSAIGGGWLELSGRLGPSWALPARLDLELVHFLQAGGLMFISRNTDDPGWRSTTVVERDGRFDFQNLAPGSWSVEVVGRDGTRSTYVVKVWRDVSDLELGDEAEWPVTIFRERENPEQALATAQEPPSPHVRLTLVLDAPRPRERVRGTLRFESPGIPARDWRLGFDEHGVLRRLGGPLRSGGEEAVEKEIGDAATLVIPGVPEGRHTLTLRLPGYAPASREVEVKGPTRLVLALRQAPGHWVRVETEAQRWWLECRVAGDGDAPWESLLEANKGVYWPWKGEQGEAWLAEGRYVFRLRSEGWAPTVWGPVDVLESGQPLVLRPTLAKGVTLSGPAAAPDLRWIDDEVLYLFRRSTEGGWHPVTERTVRVKANAYAFRGVGPGRYRIAPTTEGRPVLAEVEVGAEDVVAPIDFGPPEGR